MKLFATKISCGSYFIVAAEDEAEAREKLNAIFDERFAPKYAENYKRGLARKPTLRGGLGLELSIEADPDGKPVLVVE